MIITATFNAVHKILDILWFRPVQLVTCSEPPQMTRYPPVRMVVSHSIHDYASLGIVWRSLLLESAAIAIDSTSKKDRTGGYLAKW